MINNRYAIVLAVESFPNQSTILILFHLLYLFVCVQIYELIFNSQNVQHKMCYSI